MSELFDRAKKVIPGGVNSPVRSFSAVGIEPKFIKSANLSKIYDIDNNEYIDYICSWGPMILGHNNPIVAEKVIEAVKAGTSYGAPTEREVIIAEMITSVVPNIDMVRMVNSGTEAVMSTLRLARGYTKRNKIIKFQGCYHGHSDSMLISAGSGALTLATPNSAGVTATQTQDTLLAQYNDIESVTALFEKYPDDIAGVIVEPVAANMGVVLPKDDFLQSLRKVCDKYNCLLIFDEVITGFRLALGGAQEFFGVKADIVTFGKIIGGGMPVGAYAGSREIMSMVSPIGPVYQAGTLSGNPVAMAAGIAQLDILMNTPQVYTKINQSAKYLADSMRNTIAELNIPVVVNQIGSLLCVFFTDQKVCDFPSAKSSNTSLYAEYFRNMLSRGINLAPAQFESMFVSYSHTVDDLEKTCTAFRETMISMKDKNLF